MNLDAIINEVGFEIANLIDKNLIDKLLGVLANDGVYAFWVYSINKIEQKDIFDLLILLNKFPINVKDNNGNNIDLKSINEHLKKIYKHKEKKEEYKNLFKKNEAFFQNLSQDLHQLLFFKQLLEKALIYARYHAKALGD